MEQQVYGPPVVMGDDSIMKEKSHGSTEEAVQTQLRWGVDRDLANRMCCYNRQSAERAGYFRVLTFTDEFREEEGKEPFEFFDSVTGKLTFRAPVGRTSKEFLRESKKQGWLSFRDPEVNWKIVRLLPGGECVTVDGTHLGHSMKDSKGNRYRINIVSVAGYSDKEAKEDVKESESEGSVCGSESKVYKLQKNLDLCTGLFWRSNPTKGRVKLLPYGDWPRDDALLKGKEHQVKRKKWLQVKYIKQPTKGSFTKTNRDVWIPFFHQQYFLVEE